MYEKQLQWLIKMAQCQGFKDHSWIRAQELDKDPSGLWTGIAKDLVQYMRSFVGPPRRGIRDAFLSQGHDAMSCDLLPTEVPGPHYQGSILDVLGDGWDLMVCHPPCTHLAVSGARHFAAKQASGVQDEAIEFVRLLLNAPIPHIALENPISIISTRIRKPDQIIQPWMFGHGETKATCLWLKGLPNLVPTNIVSGREARVHKMAPGPNRWKERSRTLEGVASAMAQQWVNL
jgi:hypothetical protein